MADIYGSTLDSLMQNRVAQQQADAAEANSYRNYLAQMANTNIRRQEQQDTNAYRWGDLGVRNQLGMGDLGIRQQDVLGSNKYREGQIDIGKSNAQTQKDALQLQSELGWAPYYMTKLPSDIEKATAEELRARAKSLASGIPNDPNSRLMFLADSEKRAGAKNSVKAFKNLIDQEMFAINDSKNKWFGRGPYNEIKSALGSSVSEADINRAVRNKAYTNALAKAKALGLIQDPSIYSFDPETGDVSVAPSPFASLGRNSQPQTDPAMDQQYDLPPIPSFDYSNQPLSIETPAAADAFTPFRAGLAGRVVQGSGRGTNNPSFEGFQSWLKANR